ncbi:unnamed protein product [Clonostachys rosea f. rosea IK726]|uniref:Uncharacterized protein n=1 Tax=Clonostachys rosea f. rosea IK726 TaxID=1349383 RepID=A0ACA9U6I1_BIOOC|nr:unnamed protein product [Clonostachys rosea f. rosea IK726]
MAASNHTESIYTANSINQEVLNATRDGFRASRLSVTGKPYDKIVIGAAAFRYTPGSPDPPRLLLLKGAAHEHFYPNVFEIPGGKVDPEDLSIKHAVVRDRS